MKSELFFRRTINILFVLNVALATELKQHNLAANSFDARHLILPDLQLLSNQRDILDSLGITTSAPQPGGLIYLHLDIPDSIYDAGPVSGMVFYNDGNGNSWSQSDAYLLQTEGYERTFEAVAEVPVSGNFNLGVQAALTVFDVNTILSQSPYNPDDDFPAPYYLPVVNDVEGDEDGGGSNLDIQQISVSLSDDRIHVRFTNYGGSYSTSSFFGPWNMYAVGFLNPSDTDSTFYGLAYGNGGFGILYPGLWKFELDSDFPEYVGDIDYSIDGNDLYMAANIDDMVYDSDFGEWPNEFEALGLSGVSLRVSFTSITFSDMTDPVLLNPDFQTYEAGINTEPTLSQFLFEEIENPSGAPIARFQITYSDDDNNFPVDATLTIENDWDISQQTLFSFDHFYLDGALFEISVPLQPDNYYITFSFNDGMDQVEYSTSVNIGGSQIINLNSDIIDIPSDGGSFPYEAHLTNTGDTPESYVALLYADLPNGTRYGPIAPTPANVQLSPGQELSVTLTQQVPGAAPNGEYNFYCLLIQDEMVTDSSGFTFTKQGPTMMGSGSNDGKWVAYYTAYDQEAHANDVWSGEGLYRWDGTQISAMGVLGMDDVQIPDVFQLHQNYPNPFNPTTKVRYDLAERSNINITIYDVMGRKVKVLFSGMRGPGYHSVLWDGTNRMNEPVSAGMYFYTLETEVFKQTKKMVLLK